MKDARIGLTGKTNGSTTGKVNDINKPFLNYLKTC